MTDHDPIITTPAAGAVPAPAPHMTTRLPELDALRGVAVLMVLAFHYTVQFTVFFPERAALSVPVAWGEDGVQLFFAISGFVILMTLDRTERARDFLRARFARLFPAYWTAIAITTLVVALAGTDRLAVPPAAALANLTMLHGWFGYPSVDGVYWSLMVELCFYAIMLAIWHFRLMRWVPVILCGWLGLHLAWAHVPDLPWIIGNLLIVEHIPYFAIGMTFYLLRTARVTPIQAAALLLLTLGSAALAAPRALYVAGAIIATFAAVHAGALRWISVRPLLWLGAISYPLYLLHQHIGFAIMDGLQAQGWGAPVAALAATITVLILADIVMRLVERPALALLKRPWPWAQRAVVTP